MQLFTLHKQAEVALATHDENYLTKTKSPST